MAFHAQEEDASLTVIVGGHGRAQLGVHSSEVDIELDLLEGRGQREQHPLLPAGHSRSLFGLRLGSGSGLGL